MSVFSELTSVLSARCAGPTTRELDVFDLVALGLSNTDIAA